MANSFSKKVGKAASAFVEKTIDFSEWVAIAGLLYMFGMVVAVVVLRYFFDFSIRSGNDQAMAMVPFVLYVGAAGALRGGMLPVVEVVTQRMRPKWRNITLIFNLILASISVAVYLWAVFKFIGQQYGTGMVLESWRVVPYWAVNVVIAFGVTIFLIANIYYCILAILAFKDKKYRVRAHLAPTEEIGIE